MLIRINVIQAWHSSILLLEGKIDCELSAAADASTADS
jgi:hypothetical protein